MPKEHSTFRTPLGSLTIVLRQKSATPIHNHKGVLMKYEGDTEIKFPPTGELVVDANAAKQLRSHHRFNIDFFEDKGISALPENEVSRPKYNVPIRVIEAMNKEELVEYCSAYGIAITGDNGSGETKKTILDKIKAAMGIVDDSTNRSPGVSNQDDEVDNAESGEDESGEDESGEDESGEDYIPPIPPNQEG